MTDVTCPWCEAALLEPLEASDEGRCVECLTTWRYEEETIELPLAA